MKLKAIFAVGLLLLNSSLAVSGGDEVEAEPRCNDPGRDGEAEVVILRANVYCNCSISEAVSAKKKTLLSHALFTRTTALNNCYCV